MLRYMRVAPVWGAVAVGLSASVTAGGACASMHTVSGNYRRNVCVAAMLCADLALALCVPNLAAPMVTAIGGAGMVIVAVADGGGGAAAAVVAVGVAAITAGTVGAPVTHQTPAAGAIAALVMVVLAGGSAAIAFARSPHRWPSFTAAVAAGVQSVGTLACVYWMMNTATTAAAVTAMAITAASAIIELAMTRLSLTHIPARIHLPVQFATWQIGVYVATPVVAGHPYHVSALVVVGTIATLVGAALATAR